MNSRTFIYTIETNGETTTVFSSRVDKNLCRKYWIPLMRVMECALDEGILEDAVPDSVLTDSIRYNGCDWAVLDMELVSEDTVASLVVPMAPGALPVLITMDTNPSSASETPSYAMEIG